jgi:hypothetical protein
MAEVNKWMIDPNDAVMLLIDHQSGLVHYESQTEEEVVAEDEAAFEGVDQIVMEIPTDLVPKVRELIAKHQAA